MRSKFGCIILGSNGYFDGKFKSKAYGKTVEHKSQKDLASIVLYTVRKDYRCSTIYSKMWVKMRIKFALSICQLGM